MLPEVPAAINPDRLVSIELAGWTQPSGRISSWLENPHEYDEGGPIRPGTAVDRGEVVVVIDGL